MKYIIAATSDPLIRAVYYTRIDKDRSGNSYFCASGLPIMFLRDHGMERAAEQLIEEANVSK